VYKNGEPIARNFRVNYLRHQNALDISDRISFFQKYDPAQKNSWRLADDDYNESIRDLVKKYTVFTEQTENGDILSVFLTGGYSLVIERTGVVELDKLIQEVS